MLVHGGMAQNVGPILEMVTEKYLLRSEAEWQGRQEACQVLDDVLAALRAGDVQRIGAVTTRNFFGPIQTIIPWASNLYTETLIERARDEFGADFWGFWMLGGMSGGGMGFIFDPQRKQDAQDRMQEIMHSDQTRAGERPALCHGAGGLRLRDQRARHVGGAADGRRAALLPARLLRHDRARALLRLDRRTAAVAAAGRAGPLRRRLPHAVPSWPAWCRCCSTGCCPRRARPKSGQGRSAGAAGRERLRPRAARADPRRPAQRAHRPGAEPAAGQHRHPGRGARRRLRRQPAVCRRAARRWASKRWRRDAAAVVTLAGGVGSRWTQGAGVVKALHPFCKLGGQAPHLHRDAPGQEPAHRPPLRPAPSRTSSPPAT